MIKPNAAFISAWLIAFSCAHAAAENLGTNDSILQAPPSTGHINFVGRKPIQQGFEAVTGGKTSGSRRYRVEKWQESVPYQFGKGILTLLWSADDATLSSSGVLSDGPRVRAVMETQLVKQFDVLERLRGVPTTRPIVKFRIVPSGVSFEHLARTYPREGEKPPLDLVVVAPQPGTTLEAWIQSIVMTSVHEYVHMLQWDYAGEGAGDLYVQEAQAYGVQICATWIANEVVPEIVYQFPPLLQEAVGDYRDIPIAEIISQSKEQKESPTFAGMGAAVLAFHRFFSELKEREHRPAVINQALPLCSAIARGEITWSDKGIDAKISEFAKAARRPERQ